ncbi:unnamed protein product [Lasius platythorax]|uniref:Uncharacterized protein n=1 Tax=Lasius platythorax TaxID=488582 RepID=A0AAV2P0D5_9HYME
MLRNVRYNDAPYLGLLTSEHLVVASAGYGFGEQRTSSAREIAKCQSVRCAVMSRREEEEGTTEKVLAPVPRHIHLAGLPRICVHA